MNKQTIKGLNQLNQKFYQTVADDFDESRSFYWQGWEKILPIIQSIETDDSAMKVLDLGCGNGRFAKFLQEKLGRGFSYLGMDNSKKLLDKAEQDLSKLKIKELKLQNVDLVEFLIEEKALTKKGQNFDLIVLFGVWHHLPSQELRVKFLQSLESLLADQGIIVITAWQFLKRKSLKNRVIKPENFLSKPSLKEINPLQLERGDYILDWQRGNSAYRYCHYTTKKEFLETLSQTSLGVIDSFEADSKTNDLNQYWVLKKTN